MPNFFDQFDTQPQANFFDQFDAGAAAPALSSGFTGTGAAMSDATLNSLPVLGPLIQGAGDRAAAGIRSLWKGSSYSDELKRQQDTDAAIQNQFQSDHPIATGAGDVLGAVAGTAPLVAAAPTAFGVGGGGMLARMGLGALSGAAINGGDAAVRDWGDPNWAQDVGRGSALGALTGGAVPLAGQGVGYLYDRAIGAGAGPLAGMPAGARNFLTQPFLDGQGPQIQGDLSRLGSLGMLADVDPTFNGAAQGAGTIPETRTKIFRALMDRDAGKNGRLAGDLDSSLGSPVLPSAVDAQIADGKDALGPAYQSVLGGASAVNTEPLANSLDAQIVNTRGNAQNAIQGVRRDLNIPGTDTLDPYPNALLATRHAIDGRMATEADPNTIRALTNARNGVDAQLTANVPGIKDVDAQYEQLAGQGDAFKYGQTIFDTGKTAPRPQDVQAWMEQNTQPNGTMIGPNAAPFRAQQGARTELDRIAGQNANDPVALARAVKGNGDFARGNLAAVAGDDNADAALNAIDREKTFWNTKNDVTGNSSTALRQRFGEALKSYQGQYETPMTWEKMLFSGPAALVNAVRGSVAQRAGARFAGSLGDAVTAQGPSRDALVNALMKQAGKGRYLYALPQSGNVALRSGAQGGAQYLTPTPSPSGQ